jgi:hypothetical protein
MLELLERIFYMIAVPAVLVVGSILYYRWAEERKSRR